MLTGLIATGNKYTIHGKAHAAEEPVNLQDMEISDVFHLLCDDKYLYNKKRMKKLVNQAFKNRQESVIEHAIAILDEPMNIGEGEWLVSNYQFRVAEEVLISLNKKALRRMLEKYEISDSLTKGNIIHVVSKFDNNDRRIRDLLSNALEDNSFCEEEDDTIGGTPLRVCDVAYNELVLRYDIQEVPRTIGSIHRVTVRDEQIKNLKKILKKY